IAYNTYTDVTYIDSRRNQTLVIGANFIYDRFNEEDTSDDRDNTARTGGIYGQYTRDLTKKMQLESGLRIDATNYNNDIYSNSEILLLPRGSLLIKYNSQWSSSIGSGMGYKTPTLFTEETETIQYR